MMTLVVEFWMGQTLMSLTLNSLLWGQCVHRCSVNDGPWKCNAGYSFPPFSLSLASNPVPCPSHSSHPSSSCGLGFGSLQRSEAVAPCAFAQATACDVACFFPLHSSDVVRSAFSTHSWKPPSIKTARTNLKPCRHSWIMDTVRSLGCV